MIGNPIFVKYSDNLINRKDGETLMIDSRLTSQTHPSSTWSALYPPETLRQIGTQVEAVMSQHSSLGVHKQAIERQLASIAARINEQEGALIPRDIFLLLELRGSGQVSEQLEQIARILHEEGYWKPRGRVQYYSQQDVYQLGKSIQKLFDDYAALHQRAEQMCVRLEAIKEHRQMTPEVTPQGVFACLATTVDCSSIQAEVDAMVALLEQANRPGWFRRLFGYGTLWQR
jgi:hypothetical protein